MSRKAFFVLLAAYLLSLAVRAPHVGRPLSAHHEFCTALVLIFLENWRDGGFAEHKGCPASNFPGAADRYVYPESYAFATSNGVFYYLSHTPLSYYLPHLLFTLSGTAPNETGLTLFNLFFHFTTALLLFGVLRITLARDDPSDLPRVPLAGALFYLFMPAPLWFHGNAYMADMFVQNLWALHLLVAVQLFQPGAPFRHRDLMLYAFTLALTVYTNWLGVLIGAVGFAYALYRLRQDGQRAWWRVLWLGVAAVALPLLLTAWQYAQVLEPGALLKYLAYRFHDRATMDFVEGGALTHLGRLGGNYVMGWLPMLLLMAGAGLLLFLQARRGRTSPWPQGTTLFVLLTAAPVLLDHALLLKYADHDFAALKGGFFLCGMAALLADRVLRQMGERWPALLLPGVVLGCVLGVLLFYHYNPLPDGDHVRYDRQQRWGYTIAAEAQADEVVFALGFDPEPQVQWYARRNIKPVASEQEALAVLERRGMKGILFMPAEGGLVYRRLGMDQRSE